MKIEKEILQKKKRIEKKKNTNKYCDFQRFEKLLFVEGKLGGGFEKGPPIKKKGLPPLPWWLITIYVALSFALLVCLPCFLAGVCLTSLLAGCCAVCVLYLPWCVVSLTALLIAPNKPFNTLVSVYIRSIDIVLIITIITRYNANK